jgi:adenylosuccinate lyase
VRRDQQRLEAAKADVAVGKLSGPVGSHATVPPELEDRVCARLGLGVDAVSTQVVSRDRHAHFLQTLALIGASVERFATESASAAHRSRRG